MSDKEKMIYDRGFKDGIAVMEKRIAEAYELGRPIEAGGRVWFISSDRDNLERIVDDLFGERQKGE